MHIPYSKDNVQTEDFWNVSLTALQGQIKTHSPFFILFP